MPGPGWSAWLPWLASAAFVALLLRAERRAERRGVWLWKPLASAAFLAAALLWGAGATTYGRWILVGLGLSACGDLLLIPSGDSFFRLGLVAFLCAHLAYAAAFLSVPPAGAAVALAVPVVALVTSGVWRWLAPHLPARERWPVGAYFLVIAAMGVLALGAVAAGAPFTAAAGALAFMASDVSVARERFVSPGFVNSAWGLPLYFAAQLLLAHSAAATIP